LALPKALRLREALRPRDVQITLAWAALVGLLAALAAAAFRAVLAGLQQLLWGHAFDLALVGGAAQAWQRVLVPAAGGLIAGLVLQWGRRLSKDESAPEYLEAVALGEGTIPVRPSLVKCVSALFTIASGGSIGREGVLVQFAAMLSSWVGRFAELSRPRLELMVACGAAAGIASAYNAPLAGALFVSEIALASIAMETLGPLVLASVIATTTTQWLLGPEPLFAIPQFQLVSPLELVPYLVLGVLLGALAPLWVRCLRGSEALFTRLALPLAARMALGGLGVGLLALLRPEVYGNGAGPLGAILVGSYAWQILLLVLALKLVATALTAGSGAHGGVFTPTLFAGAACGFVFGTPVHALLPEWTGSPSAYALVGMGAFLAAATHAPLTAILMLYELTHDFGIVLPLMAACVVAYTTSRGLSAPSLYTHRRRPGAPALGSRRVRDLMKRDPVRLRDDAPFRELVRVFTEYRHNYVYITDADGRFLGAVSLHEIKPHIADPELTELVIVRDLLHDEFPRIEQDATLGVAMEAFLRHDGERLPVVDGQGGSMLVGSISKTDLLLSLAIDTRRE
jgi:CIC family chloride channel protein